MTKPTPFTPEHPIEIGTRVSAANGWDEYNNERPRFLGTVVERKREGERWARVEWDEAGIAMPKCCSVPCYSLCPLEATTEKP